MKVYFIYSRKYKEIIYISVIKSEVDKFWVDERLDEKYYGIKATKTKLALDWIQGRVRREKLVKELEEQICEVEDVKAQEDQKKTIKQ